MEHKRVLPKNVKIVAVDGLDASGKESLVKELKKWIPYDIEVITESLPRYGTEIGQRILEELHKKPEERDSESLHFLFKKDTRDFFDMVVERYKHEDKKTIILLDRCHFSNYLYGSLEKFDDAYLKNELIAESKELPKMHMLLLLGRFTKAAETIHELLLWNKKGKDQNETEEVQKRLSERLKMIHTKIPKCMDIQNVELIPIGSYFTNDEKRPFDIPFIQNTISKIVSLFD